MPFNQTKDTKIFKVLLLGSFYLNNKSSKNLKAFVLQQKPEVQKDLSQRYLWIWLFISWTETQ